MTLDTGVFSATTCNQPPGAAQRSITTRALWRNSNFLFNWINLNADLALYPENTQSLEFLCWLTNNCISKTPFRLWTLIVSVTHWNYSLSVCILCENVVTQTLPLRSHWSEGDLPFRLFMRLAGTSGLQITTRPLANASNFYLWATKTLGFDRPHGE